MTNKTKITSTILLTALLLGVTVISMNLPPAFAGSPPIVQPSGVPALSLNGNCYAAVPLNPGFDRTYGGAFALAPGQSVNGIPGHLATLNSPAEDALTLAFPQGWIGYTRDAGFLLPGAPTMLEQDGFQWGWVTGETPVSTNWFAPQEPNNANNNELYATHNTFNGQWNDIDINGFGNTVQRMIVEFPNACTEIGKTLVEGPEEIGIYLPIATVYQYTIEYTGFAALVKDTVPAEFEVVSLVATDGTAIDFKPGKGNKSQSSTKIEWLVPAGTSTLTVEIQTVVSPGHGKKTPDVFKPTSCGALPINDGATAFEVDQNGDLVLVPYTDPDTGEVTVWMAEIEAPTVMRVVLALAWIILYRPTKTDERPLVVPLRNQFLATLILGLRL